MLCVLTPPQYCSPEDVVSGVIKELFADFDGCVVEVLFSSKKTNSLKDFPSERLSGNGSNDINCIFFFFYKVGPLSKDVFSFGHVVIARFTIFKRSKSLFKVGFGLVSSRFRRSKFLLEALNLVSILIFRILVCSYHIALLILFVG